ncbi:MAG: ABC transporter permease [Lachnospiraceae bacterium]|nr:ABC transporter permease [Lachnospiraceae bacterium]
MWKDYSSGYLKNNRASCLSVMIAAFISALLLSLLCSLFYNLWNYEVERIKAEEGGWQGRIAGTIGMEEMERIRNHDNVEKALINEDLSDEQEIVVDVYLKKIKNVFRDMAEIAELAGLSEEAVTYHYELLNLYFVRDSGDSALRWVFPFALLITAAACFSLILVIHNAFALTMNARVHQFGILASIGATPKQILTCLLQEASALCAAPIAVGSLFGILLSMGLVTGTNVMLADVERRLVLPFRFHPATLFFSLAASILTVWISAWIPARKLSRLTPLEAIRNTGELQLKKKRSSRFLAFFFGIEGELAGNALKAQRKAMRTAFTSLLLAFLSFSFMMCFITITAVSQRETYFAKYQDSWDVMATVENMEIDAFEETDALQELDGIQSCVIYQKAMAKRYVTSEEISKEMQAIGGFGNAAEEYVTENDGAWLVNAPIVILDDASFLEYCVKVGAEPRLDGAVILNRTRDAADPNFRERRMLPYLTEYGRTTQLRQAGQEEKTAEIPVISYTQEVPALREEYGTLDFYELVHFLPVSLWKEIKGEIGGLEEDIYIRILAKDGVTQPELDEVEAAVLACLKDVCEIETENRIQEKNDNDKMFAGMKAILSVFCVLLATIGIGNVFSNTLGFVRQRKREFARYLSVGLTPAGIRKMFCIEALVIAGRPVLIALPVTAFAVAFFIRMSYLEPLLFIREIPFLPIGSFVLGIFSFVALAYYLGAKKVMGSSLADSLRDDTML